MMIRDDLEEEATKPSDQTKEARETVMADLEKAKGSLRHFGTNWSKMAEAVRDKTEDQCKKFFYYQRKRFQLDKLVQEYKRANRPGGDDKPSLTSDEESGSSTSSGGQKPKTSHKDILMMSMNDPAVFFRPVSAPGPYTDP